MQLNSISNQTQTLTQSGVIDTIGNTPLIKLDKLSKDKPYTLFGKLESANPGGSIKDRTAKQLIENAMRLGYLHTGGTVIESSSGNLAVGLAQVCKYYEVNLIVVVDPKINQQTLKILKAYGAQIDYVRKACPKEGFLGARLNRVKELLDKHPGSFWPNQYGNFENPKAHEQTMREIVKSLEAAPDYLFVATSTCGTLMGCAQYIKDNGLPTKLIAVDAKGSVLFNRPAGDREIPGHGASRPSQLLNCEYVDDVIHVDDMDCVRGCHLLLDTEALMCGGSSGAIVSAIEKYSDNLPFGSVCAAILCDKGERYLDTIYNWQWVAMLKTKQRLQSAN
ncbi:2,3-diaminopropionate biosynthesis protein SbnA [Fulvivirga sp. RKSG066]|uniref:2,3-diaminopropionate biosynthesis protein SbnA n=1 Tax=Fulvivirga aurantia TaxID=2529383 RepID=UPI0012BCDE21|nr:2,3-diaminopropionate biosynthesis protein SbnA [Fulvivirga aurantia]MTI21434.1 2,3-diaminopropionate biosynthesis protein SbnA [Fulvivirga aurantia]